MKKKNLKNLALLSDLSETGGRDDSRSVQHAVLAPPHSRFSCVYFLPFHAEANNGLLQNHFLLFKFNDFFSIFRDFWWRWWHYPLSAGTQLVCYTVTSFNRIKFWCCCHVVCNKVNLIELLIVFFLNFECLLIFSKNQFVISVTRDLKSTLVNPCILYNQKTLLLLHSLYLFNNAGVSNGVFPQYEKCRLSTGLLSQQNQRDISFSSLGYRSIWSVESSADYFTPSPRNFLEYFRNLYCCIL